MSERDPTAAAQGLRRRAIRSFVLRQGRLTPGQQRALDQHWPRYGLDWPPPTRPLDFDQVFGRRAPRVLEIGFGNGEVLLAGALAEPQRDFIGIEVHRPGVGRLLREASAAGVTNLRVFNADAVEVLREGIAAAALDEVRIYFPDPWHKKRHHKRRLIQPGFVALLAGRLRPGGLVHLATDWQDYAEQMLAVMQASPDFDNLAADAGFSPRPQWRPPSHFERRGQRLGHGVWDLLYRRRAP